MTHIIKSNCCNLHISDDNHEITIKHKPTTVNNNTLEIVHWTKFLDIVNKLSIEDKNLHSKNCILVCNDIYILQQLLYNNMHNITPIIKIFKSKKELSYAPVMPTKNIMDVGYDLTIVNFNGMATDNTYIYDTGISVQPPIGYYTEVFARSSITKLGYTIANSVGIIDPSYTGSIQIRLIKTDSTMPNLELPCRIAQFIVKPFIVSELQEVTELSNTKRGDGGFGSTG